MKIIVDGVRFDDALLFVKYGKLWERCGLVFAPLYTFQQKLLCTFPRPLIEELACEHREMLGLDKVRSMPPRRG